MMMPGDDDDDDDDSTAASSPLVISEIMYHPVLEDGFEDLHEFVELYNREDKARPLRGWKFSKGIEFTFPDDATIPAHGYVVIAKSPEALLAIKDYKLDPQYVFGGYASALDNGGETLRVESSDGRLADEVKYDDTFPWPTAADALGATEDWLPPEMLPLERHRHKGHSLERVSADIVASKPDNWRASALDKPTPGLPNGAKADRPVAVSLSIAGGTDAPGTVVADKTVHIRVGLGAGAVKTLSIEYFVDDLASDDEKRLRVPLTQADKTYEVTLPAQGANSIVRFRVLAEDGHVISPSQGEPYLWHAYFVPPTLTSKTLVYRLFINRAQWTKLADNVGTGNANLRRVNADCSLRDVWNATVPAVFTVGSVVYDVRVRYQGGIFRRDNGPIIASWTAIGPQRPSPLRALSWLIKFPRYQRFEGRSRVLLNKLEQGCPGYTTAVGFPLFEEAGVPAARVRYARLFINGSYYHYMQDMENVDEDLLERFNKAVAARTPAAKEQEVGHLFQPAGGNGTEGPYGIADGQLLAAQCNYTENQVYRYSYERETHTWDSHDALIALIKGLAKARTQNDAALKKFLSDNFDVDLVLNYLAISGWAAATDDTRRNYYLYQRREDSKWLFIPWDPETAFGNKTDPATIYRAPKSSIFIGEQGDPDAFSGWWSVFKDSFFQVYRTEYVARIKSLANTILSADRVSALITQARASVDIAEASASPAAKLCDFDTEADDFKAWSAARTAHVKSLP